MSTTSSTTSLNPTTQSLAPRPREIRINGVDLCALWTPAHLHELGMPEQPFSRSDPDGKPRCFYSNNGRPEVAYSITPYFDKDVTDWLGPGQVEQTSVTVIAGFPAVVLHGRTSTNGCNVLVSTSTGQYLQVRMSSIHPKEFTIEQMCELAKKAATFATQTLQTLR